MSETVFSKIIRGELPAFKIYEDDDVLAFLDIHPVNRGHTLVIPKNTDARNIFDLPTKDWLAMTRVVHVLATAVEKALDADGVNILMNNRSTAGQAVDHPHIHIIPRFKGDGHEIWKHGAYKEGEAEVMLQKIRETLQ
jgi:histidine triad (HIT) family protein